MVTKLRNWLEFPLHADYPLASRPGALMVAGLACVAILIITVTGLSRSLEQRSPEFARTLFPLNAEAVLNRAATLRRASPDADLQLLEPVALGLLPTHAGDPRLYSLIGEIRRRAGDSQNAFIAFDQAFALSRTEFDALLWTLQRALEQDDFSAALDRLDTLFRRWPGQVALLAPALSDVFSNPKHYPRFLERMKADPPWRRNLFPALSRDPAALAFLAQLMQDLAAGPTPPRSGEVTPVLSALLAAGRTDLAYRTFVLTLTPAERKHAGYVYNGRFLLPPSGRAFDWQIRNHPGMTATVGSGDEAGGLRVQFSNTPVLNLSVGQRTALPPGTYELEFTAAATEARLPKELLWRMVCLGSNRIVAEAPVSPGTYKATTSRTQLTIPNADCTLQALQLVTKAMVESWNDRYSGTVVFNDFRISAVD